MSNMAYDSWASDFSRLGRALLFEARGAEWSEINSLIAEGANSSARDRVGRTPAHVAAFASHDDVLTALAEGGADMNALEIRL